MAGTDYKGLIRNLIIAALLNIALNLIFIPRYSFWAAATITVVTECILLFLTALYVKQKTTFQASFRTIAPILVATGVMATCVIGVLHYSIVPVVVFAESSRLYQLTALFGVGCIGALAYGLALFGWGKRSPLLAAMKVLQS